MCGEGGEVSASAKTVLREFSLGRNPVLKGLPFWEKPWFEETSVGGETLFLGDFFWEKPCLEDTYFWGETLS